jgi:hypothetical protein
MSDVTMRTGPEWATASGDAWAELWEHTDRGLEGLSSHLLSAMLAASPKDSFRAFAQADAARSRGTFGWHDRKLSGGGLDLVSQGGHCLTGGGPGSMPQL